MAVLHSMVDWRYILKIGLSASDPRDDFNASVPGHRNPGDRSYAADGYCNSSLNLVSLNR